MSGIVLNQQIRQIANTPESIVALRKSCTIKLATAVATGIIASLAIVAVAVLFVVKFAAPTLNANQYSASASFHYMISVLGAALIGSWLMPIVLIYPQERAMAHQLSNHRGFIDFANERGITLNSSNIMTVWREVYARTNRPRIEFLGFARLDLSKI